MKKGHTKGFKQQKYKKKQEPVQQSTQPPVVTTPTMTTPQSTIKIETMLEQDQPTLGIKNSKATLVFKATDTLFFREARPMESMGVLQSVFPPSVQTMAGAVRTFIGDSQNINWHEFNEDHELTKTIGYGDDLGALNFQGAWLSFNGERLYPAPLLLMKKEGKEKSTLHRLTISDKTLYCDLGKKVRLPILPEKAQGSKPLENLEINSKNKGPVPEKAQGSKPLENTWLTATGYQAVLSGKTAPLDSIKMANDLFETESRLGIARDNTTRAVEKGMLYQTEHIRPKAGLNIELDASGLPETLPTSATIRLGGEGRSANLALQQKDKATLHDVKPNNKTQGLLLYLLTPLKFKQSSKDWQPLPNFKKEETDKQTLWIGSLNGIELELHSAVTGKAIRDGGWDLAKHQPRSANSLIPAGSVFFCTIKDGDISKAIQTLHNKNIGDNTEYGLGHIVTGLWLKNTEGTKQ